MEQDYDEIIASSTSDKFIYNNKYELDEIKSFINYACNKKLDYKTYKQIFFSLIDIKEYSMLPLVIYALLQSDYDLEDLIDIFSKLSINIINKFRGSPLLVNILNILVTISDILYSKEWLYECSTMLYTISLFITTCNVHNDILFDRYYTILSNILFISGNYYSALNALSWKEPIKNFEMYKGLCRYKNEGNKYSQYLLKMNLQDFDAGYNIFYDKFWDFYIKNIGSKISCNKENLNFISFMSKNNLSFVRENNEIIIGEFKYQSVDSKIYDIVDLYKIRKKQKNIKIVEKNEINVEKPIIKKKEIKFTDNFTIRKAKYNIYCDILKKCYRNKEMYYEIRNNARKINHEKYNKALKEKQSLFLKYKDDLDSMLVELKSKRQDKKYEFVSKVEISKKSSWRDDEEGPVNNNIYRPSLHKKEEILTDRHIYTYGATVNFNNNINENKDDGIFRPNLNIYKSKASNKSDIFVPNINNIKINEKNLENADSFKKLSEQDDVYKAPEQPYSPSTSSKTNKNKGWYDE